MLIRGRNSSGLIGCLLLTMTQMLVGSLSEWRLRSKVAPELVPPWWAEWVAWLLGAAGPPEPVDAEEVVGPVVAEAAQPATSGRTTRAETSAFTCP
jgi:hypothetical protein